MSLITDDAFIDAVFDYYKDINQSSFTNKSLVRDSIKNLVKKAEVMKKIKSMTFIEIMQYLADEIRKLILIGTIKKITLIPFKKELKYKKAYIILDTKYCETYETTINDTLCTKFKWYFSNKRLLNSVNPAQPIGVSDTKLWNVSASFPVENIKSIKLYDFNLNVLTYLTVIDNANPNRMISVAFDEFKFIGPNLYNYNANFLLKASNVLNNTYRIEPAHMLKLEDYHNGEISFPTLLSSFNSFTVTFGKLNVPIVFPQFLGTMFLDATISDHTTLWFYIDNASTKFGTDLSKIIYQLALWNVTIRGFTTSLPAADKAFIDEINQQFGGCRGVIFYTDFVANDKIWIAIDLNKVENVYTGTLTDDLEVEYFIQDYRAILNMEVTYLDTDNDNT